MKDRILKQARFNLPLFLQNICSIRLPIRGFRVLIYDRDICIPSHLTLCVYDFITVFFFSHSRIAWIAWGGHRSPRSCPTVPNFLPISPELALQWDYSRRVNSIRRRVLGRNFVYRHRFICTDTNTLRLFYQCCRQITISLWSDLKFGTYDTVLLPFRSLLYTIALLRLERSSCTSRTCCVEELMRQNKTTYQFYSVDSFFLFAWTIRPCPKWLHTYMFGNPIERVHESFVCKKFV